jgi:hypothetical protein
MVRVCEKVEGLLLARISCFPSGFGGFILELLTFRSMYRFYFKVSRGTKFVFLS